MFTFVRRNIGGKRSSARRLRVEVLEGRECPATDIAMLGAQLESPTSIQFTYQVRGDLVPFQIAVREPNHPIMRGLPPLWMHQGDELYARLRGPGRNMRVLASAYSDPANAGSGRDEPTLLALSFGKGRIFHTTLGHDINALSSVDFIVTLQRGAEWAATGQVTQNVPAPFPTANTVSYRADLAAMDPGYRLGLDALSGQRR